MGTMGAAVREGARSAVTSLKSLYKATESAADVTIDQPNSIDEERGEKGKKSHDKMSHLYSL